MLVRARNPVKHFFFGKNLNLFDEFELWRNWNQPIFVAFAQKPADGLPSRLAVVEGPMVDIHADEFIGEVAAHVARVLKRVLDGFRAVVEAVLNAGRENIRNGLTD